MTPVKVTIEFTFDLDQVKNIRRTNVYGFIKDCIENQADWPFRNKHGNLDFGKVKITSTFDTRVEN